MAKATGARPTEAEALLMHADLARLSGAAATALDRYHLARALESELGNPDLGWRLRYGEALALNETGQKEAAVESLLAAVHLIESVRSRLREKRYQSGYIQDKHDVYIDLVRLQVELGQTGDAFDSAERLRNWSDIEPPAGWVAPPANESDRVAETELRERIRQLQNSLEAEQSLPPADRRQLAIQTFSRELLLAEQEYQSLLDDQAVALPAQAKSDRRGWSAVVQQQLGPEEALVEYVVGPNNIMIFLLTASQLRAKTVAANRPDLRSRLELLRDLLKQTDNDLWQFPATSLSKTVLAPILQSGWLEGVAHLYLVPHDMLHYLPFAVLPVDETHEAGPLIRQFTLAYLPAGSLLAGERRRPRARPQSSVLALAPGNSRLKNASEEALSIAQMFRPNGKALLGDAATESAFKQAADRHRVLHLATHGYFNKLNPLLSGLQLEPDEANDGLLEVHEILDLRLRSSLVTLSACETGMGSGFFMEIPAGDDFVSLTRAFLSAGSRSVLATLWEVDDRSTLELMEGFYAQLGMGDSFFEGAHALAEAQRILSQSKDFGHPYYWAPFVLVGHPGRTRTAPKLAERGSQS
jgi:CHAT domain-containing protein